MSDTALNSIIQYGTNANRLLFTPNPASGSKVLYFWYTTDTTTLYLWNGSAWIAVSAGSQPTIPARSEGRLTVVTGTPVPTTDQTSKSTLYWTPCDPSFQSVTNGVISLYNGTSIVDISITEKSLSLSSLTSGKNYDVFMDYNSGTPQLVLSAAWTDDVTRANALGLVYDSTRFETIITKSGTNAYRWIGTIRTTGTTTTEDSAANRFVWNAYNQTRRVLSNPVETTNSWSYTTNTVRQANGNSANQFDYVTGNSTVLIEANLVAVAVAKNSSANGPKTGIGVDATTAFTGLQSASYNDGTATITSTMTTIYRGTPGLGHHYIAWLENGGDGTSTFLGDDGGKAQSGLTGSIWN